MYLCGHRLTCGCDRSTNFHLENRMYYNVRQKLTDSGCEFLILLIHTLHGTHMILILKHNSILFVETTSSSRFKGNTVCRGVTRIYGILL